MTVADRRFVGLGFGAIQAGLYLREAHVSGRFARMTLGVRRPDIVADLAAGRGRFVLNTAMADHVVAETIGPVDAFTLEDRRLVEALAEATDIAIAVSSVKDYVGLAPVLAAGMLAKARRGGPFAVLYASENHNEAAHLLERAIEAALQTFPSVARCFEVVDTVIGKMSRVVKDGTEIAAAGLHPWSPDREEAFLVEAFNRIYVTKPGNPDAAIGFDVFVQKEHLLPFEHAKLHGHNAAHAMLAYLGRLAGATFIADLVKRPDLIALVRRAFLFESGETLIRLYHDADPLFSPVAFAAFAEDLMARTLNPFLRDTVERVGRDPARKLGWEDRLIGTIRLALSQGVEPKLYAQAALAALQWANRGAGSPNLSALSDYWPQTIDPAERERVLDFLSAEQPAFSRLSADLAS